MTLSISIKKALGLPAVGSSNAPGRVPEASPGRFQLDVEFEVPAGFTILFGASGSGKTTTLKSIRTAHRSSN
jgi:ABC-type glutathione transport system ATPase component